MMDALTAYQKIIFIQEFGLEHDVQPLLNELDVDDVLELIKKYDTLNFDIKSFIGKTDSRILLERGVKLNDVKLVEQCLYCKCDFNDTMFTIALKNGNSEIVNILLDKIELKIEEYDYNVYSNICKLDHNVIVKYYNMYKDKLGMNFYEKICKSSDETFLYFYNLPLCTLKDEAECFLSCIESGKIERVKMMMHLYGKQTRLDIKYKRKYDLTSMESDYITTACITGNIEMVKYLMDNRTTQCDMTNNGYIYQACNSGNLELVHYLHDLGFKLGTKNYYSDIDRHSLPIFEWLLQHGISPLTYSCNDDGSREYDFYNMVKNKKIEYLTILQKYCNEKQVEQIVKYIIKNWDSIGDDIFLPLLNDTRFFSQCKSNQLIEHFMTLGDITEEQWTDLFINIVNKRNIDKYTPIFDKYREKLNLSLFAPKLMNSYFRFSSPQDKKLVADLLQIH